VESRLYLYSPVMGKEPTEDTLVTITCTECDHKAEKTLRWLRSNTTLECESCGSGITFSIDQASIDTADELKEMMKTWEDIKKGTKF